eukprot:scaffold151055_cov44-Attheya_sp.AAC.4
MTNQTECNPNRDKVILDSIRVSNERTVTFATAGDPDAKFKNRTNGNLMGIAPFVQPADCPSTKTIFQFGALHASSEIEFFDTMKWVYEEKGDTSADVSVLLSKGVDIGIEYKHVHGKVVIFHPEQDKLTPIAAAKWLSEQLPFGRLITLPDASHEGALFMLHTPIVDSLKSLSTSS